MLKAKTRFFDFLVNKATKGMIPIKTYFIKRDYIIFKYHIFIYEL
jgi:hypothetical protein